jgi:Protein of unknown function DUF262
MSAGSSVPMNAEDDAEFLSPEAIDFEDTGREDTNTKPWDPSKIRITTKNFSLREVVEQIRDGEIDLSPDFQRDFVWKKRQRTRLVESILLGIPLPAFYFNQDKEGRYQVVDGVQRLSSISLFMKDGHVLEKTDLEYLQNLHGSNYTQLDPAALRRFRSTQIVVHVIEPQTPEEVKYDIFGRVNTLGSPLSPQEIRHAMSKDRSRRFLKGLAETKYFDEATEWQYWRRSAAGDNGWIRDSGRMTDRELVLRFCAFSSYLEEDYRKQSSLDAFLVEFTKRLDGNSDTGIAIDDEGLEKLRANFERAMENAVRILEKAAFRRWPPAQKRRGPINRAVFESQAIALADYPLVALLEKKEQIAHNFRCAFDDAQYARSVTVGTGDPNAIARRLSRTKEILSGLLS